MGHTFRIRRGWLATVALAAMLALAGCHGGEGAAEEAEEGGDETGAIPTFSSTSNAREGLVITFPEAMDEESVIDNLLITQGEADASVAAGVGLSAGAETIDPTRVMVSEDKTTYTVFFPASYCSAYRGCVGPEAKSAAGIPVNESVCVDAVTPPNDYDADGDCLAEVATVDAGDSTLYWLTGRQLVWDLDVISRSLEDDGIVVDMHEEIHFESGGNYLDYWQNGFVEPSGEATSLGRFTKLAAIVMPENDTPAARLYMGYDLEAYQSCYGDEMECDDLEPPISLGTDLEHILGVVPVGNINGDHALTDQGYVGLQDFIMAGADAEGDMNYYLILGRESWELGQAPTTDEALYAARYKYDMSVFPRPCGDQSKVAMGNFDGDHYVDEDGNQVPSRPYDDWGFCASYGGMQTVNIGYGSESVPSAVDIFFGSSSIRNTSSDTGIRLYDADGGNFVGGEASQGADDIALIVYEEFEEDGRAGVVLVRGVVGDRSNKTLPKGLFDEGSAADESGSISAVIQMPQVETEFMSVHAPGDINADGLDDTFILWAGSIGEMEYMQAMYVFLGRTHEQWRSKTIYTSEDADLSYSYTASELSPQQGVTKVITTGDINNDGFDDFGLQLETTDLMNYHYYKIYFLGARNLGGEVTIDAENNFKGDSYAGLRLLSVLEHTGFVKMKL